MLIYGPDTFRVTSPKLVLFAAGSLSQAFKKFTEIFYEDHSIELETEFGSTARMAKLIKEGSPCDIFASADMETPQAFVDAGKVTDVLPFLRNDTVAVARKNMGVNSDNLPYFLTSAGPSRIGISDPETQPCGANAIRALSAVLSADALNRAIHIVTGGLDKKKEKTCGAKSDYTTALEEKLDLLVVFRTTAQKICAQSDQAEIIELSSHMAVTAQYGIAVLNNTDTTRRLLHDLQSEKARCIFKEYGFKF